MKTQRDIQNYLADEKFKDWANKRLLTKSIYWDVKRYEDNLSNADDLNIYEFVEIMEIYDEGGFKKELL